MQQNSNDMKCSRFLLGYKKAKWDRFSLIVGSVTNTIKLLSTSHDRSYVFACHSGGFLFMYCCRNCEHSKLIICPIHTVTCFPIWVGSSSAANMHVWNFSLSVDVDLIFKLSSCINSIFAR